MVVEQLDAVLAPRAVGRPLGTKNVAGIAFSQLRGGSLAWFYERGVVEGLPEGDGFARKDARVGAAGQVEEEQEEDEGEVEQDGQGRTDRPVVAVHEHDVRDQGDQY